MGTAYQGNCFVITVISYFTRGIKVLRDSFHSHWKLLGVSPRFKFSYHCVNFSSRRCRLCNTAMPYGYVCLMIKPLLSGSQWVCKILFRSKLQFTVIHVNPEGSHTFHNVEKEKYSLLKHVVHYKVNRKGNREGELSFKSFISYAAFIILYKKKREKKIFI